MTSLPLSKSLFSLSLIFHFSLSLSLSFSLTHLSSFISLSLSFSLSLFLFLHSLYHLSLSSLSLFLSIISLSLSLSSLQPLVFQGPLNTFATVMQTEEIPGVPQNTCQVASSHTAETPVYMYKRRVTLRQKKVPKLAECATASRRQPHYITD